MCGDNRGERSFVQFHSRGCQEALELSSIWESVHCPPNRAEIISLFWIRHNPQLLDNSLYVFCNELGSSCKERKWKLCCCFIFYEKKLRLKPLSNSLLIVQYYMWSRLLNNCPLLNNIMRPEMQLIRDYSPRHKVGSGLLFEQWFCLPWQGDTFLLQLPNSDIPTKNILTPALSFFLSDWRKILLQIYRSQQCASFAH